MPNRTPENCPHRRSEPIGSYHLVQCGYIIERVGIRYSVSMMSGCQRCCEHPSVDNSETREGIEKGFKARVFGGDAERYVWYFEPGRPEITPEEACRELMRSCGYNVYNVDIVLMTALDRVDKVTGKPNLTPERVAEIGAKMETEYSTL